MHVAERLRELVAQRTERPMADRDVTVTIGVAHRSGESSDELIAKADLALYAGKAAGRNRVHAAQPVPTPSDHAAMPGVASDDSAGQPERVPQPVVPH